jgi:hypothetical protein
VGMRKTGTRNDNCPQASISRYEDGQSGAAKMLLKFCDNMHTILEMVPR